MSRSTRLRWLLRPVEDSGHPSLEVLSVYREHGVIPKSSRSDNFNKTPTDLNRYQRVQPGDLVVNKMKAWSGSLGVASHEGIVSPDYLVCTVDPSVDSGFLHHLLRSRPLIAEMQKRSKGIRPSQERLYWEDLAEIVVPLPPLEEQRRVADFLDDQVSLLDRIIHLRQQQAVMVSERLKETLRVQVAGDSGATGPSPAPWVAALSEHGVLQPLARTLTLQRGVDLTEAERRPGHVPVFTTAGANGFHDIAIVNGPGVVIGRYGSVGSVFWADGPHWPHNTTLYVRDYKGNDPRYVYYLLKTYPYERLQARAAVPGVNRNDMAPDLMPWLPLARQQDAVRACESAEWQARALSSSIKAHIGLLQERQQTLITAAVTGAFDVSTASVRRVA